MRIAYSVRVTVTVNYNKKMTMKYVISCIVMAGIMAASSARAQQQTAFVDFIGHLQEATCSLIKNNATLTIGKVDEKVFTQLGTESQLSNVDSIVTATSSPCTATGVSMTFNAAAVSPGSNLFAVTGGATGVGIKLEAQLVNGQWLQAFPSTSPSARPITNSTGIQNFRARYVRTGTVGTGTANATIIVVVTYT